MSTAVKSEKLKIRYKPARLRASLLFLSLFTIHFSLLSAGCGFHLRGAVPEEIPPVLREMRVVVPGSQLAYDPLKLEVQDVLRNQPGITLVEKGEVPTLVLMRERFDRQVLTVSSAGKAREFQLRYEVSFQLHDAEGGNSRRRKHCACSATISTTRTSRSPSDRVEQELRESMRRDAAQQILRRLVKLKMLDAERKIQ